MSSPQVVDWLKCIICQKETAEKTQCPANSKRNDSGAGYLTIEHDLTSFHEAGKLHLAVDWENLDEGNGISQTFVWRKPRPKEQQTDKNTFSRQQTISCMLLL